MKAETDAILQQEQAAYLEEILPERDEIARDLETHAHQNNVPVVDPEVGRFLYISALAIGAQNMLEIGTATGYSGLCLARAIPSKSKGRLITIDIDPDRQQLARETWTRAGVNEHIETICGPALEHIGSLKGPFDLLFIDAIKTEYKDYLDLALPLLRPGALVIADNVLWKGLIAKGDTDIITESLREFNKYAMNHPRLSSIILALGDGLLYATVL